MSISHQPVADESRGLIQFVHVCVLPVRTVATREHGNFRNAPAGWYPAQDQFTRFVPFGSLPSTIPTCRTPPCGNDPSRIHLSEPCLASGDGIWAATMSTGPSPDASGHGPAVVHATAPSAACPPSPGRLCRLDGRGSSFSSILPTPRFARRATRRHCGPRVVTAMSPPLGRRLAQAPASPSVLPGRRSAGNRPRWEYRPDPANP